jgi:spermidine synthase
MERKKTLIAALIVMGISGIIAQILLLRELLINFYGNELSIGIILANWLLLESAGAFLLGKQIERIKAKTEAFILVTLLFAMFMPGAVYLARISKDLFGHAPAEAAGIAKIFYSSLLVFLPVSITHGALFTFGCKIHSLNTVKTMQDVAREASSTGKVYIYETIGTIIGGVCLTFFLIPYFDSFRIAFALAILNIIVCISIGRVFWKGCLFGTRKLLLALSVLLLTVFSYILFSPASNAIHKHSLRHRWPGQEIVFYKNSIYGNIAVTKSQQQYTFFSDGIPIITVPTPDAASIEEFVHLPLLSHPSPKDILVVSGGAGGIINEILKHNVKKIDYVELDPLVLTAVRKFPVELTLKELSDRRVNIKHTDGKLFVKTTPLKYDIILIGLNDPSSLSVNRLFTKEFFSLLADRLNPEGIIAFGLPGSLTYLGDDMKNLNACILNALKEAFPYTKIIPGDGTNIYMASLSKQLSKADKHTLIERFGQRNINTVLISPFHIKYKLQPQWRDWFTDSLKGATKKENLDFAPIGTFFSLSYWNSMFSPYMQPFLKACEKTTLRFFILFFIITGIIITTVSAFSKYPFKVSVPVSIISTGFAGMLFDLIIIFSFQIIYGYVFYWLGLLVSVFMAGALAGSFLVTKNLKRIKNELSFFLKTEGAIIIFALILPFILNHKIVFLIASLVSGLIVGMQFLLANKIHLAQGRSGISDTAGLLYSSDLLGGWISGMIGGVVLIPVLGVLNSCLVIAALKIMSFLVFGFSMVKTETYPQNAILSTEGAKNLSSRSFGLFKASG